MLFSFQVRIPASCSHTPALGARTGTRAPRQRGGFYPPDGPHAILRTHEHHRSRSLIAIAMMAARADGRADSTEQKAVDAVVERLGNPDVTRLALQVAGGKLRVADLASRLSDDEARRVAYEGALAICNADGMLNAAEAAFLEELRCCAGAQRRLRGRGREDGRSPRRNAPRRAALGRAPAGPLDELILQQAMLTGALEILPDRLATIAILPLQLRLVYQIGQRNGQKLDVNQVKDLAATLGLGAVTQGMESVVLKIAGGLAGRAPRRASSAARRGWRRARPSPSRPPTPSATRRSSTTRRAARSAAPTSARCSSGSSRTRRRSIRRWRQQIRAQSGTLNLQSLLQALRTT